MKNTTILLLFLLVLTGCKKLLTVDDIETAKKLCEDNFYLDFVSKEGHPTLTRYEIICKKGV